VSYLHGIPCYRTHALRKKHLIRTKCKHERSADTNDVLKIKKPY